MAQVASDLLFGQLKVQRKPLRWAWHWAGLIPQKVSPLQTEGAMEAVERKRQMGERLQKNLRIYWLGLRSQR